MDLKNKILNFTIDQFEGGKVNNKKDHGGLTNWGITKPFLAWIEGVPVVHIADAEITGMSRADALENYSIAWSRYKIEAMPEKLWHIYWDMCVNSGPVNAVKIIQRALSIAGYNVGAVDGVAGRNTIAQALLAAQKIDLVAAVVQARIQFYKAIVTNDPSQSIFLNGWINRAKWFQLHVLTADV